MTLATRIRDMHEAETAAEETYWRAIDASSRAYDAAIEAAADGDLDRAHDMHDAATHHANRARAQREHAAASHHGWALDLAHLDTAARYM